MNSGWANTAKVKKLLHFELRVTASVAYTPTADKSFDVTKIGLSNGVTPTDPNQTITPTVGASKDVNGVTLNINDNNGRTVSTFTLPSGQLPKQLPGIPFPQVQLTVGLLERTDLTIRYVPTINVGSNIGSVNMIGFGLKHDLTKYIFGHAKKIIPFDLSVLLAYSRLNLNANVNVQPEAGSTGPNDDFSDQHIKGDFSSFLAEAIISKKLLFFTPFLAVGYNTASTNLAALGNYPVESGVDSYTVYTNPININETSISGFRADVGFQLNLGIRIFASYSLAEYKSVNAGIGFGF